jgi:hypothetical protein
MRLSVVAVQAETPSCSITALNWGPAEATKAISPVDENIGVDKIAASLSVF